MSTRGGGDNCLALVLPSLSFWANVARPRGRSDVTTVSIGDCGFARGYPLFQLTSLQLFAHPDPRGLIGGRDGVPAANYRPADVRCDITEHPQCAGPLICQTDVFRFIERRRELLNHDLKRLDQVANIRKRLFYAVNRCFRLSDLRASGV